MWMTPVGWMPEKTRFFMDRVPVPVRHSSDRGGAGGGRSGDFSGAGGAGGTPTPPHTFGPVGPPAASQAAAQAVLLAGAFLAEPLRHTGAGRVGRSGSGDDGRTGPRRVRVESQQQRADAQE